MTILKVKNRDCFKLFSNKKPPQSILNCSSFVTIPNKTYFEAARKFLPLQPQMYYYVQFKREQQISGV